MENNNETFNYTYSAGEQEEIKRIRQKYMPKESDKMELIRQLDRSVTQKGTTASIIVGTVGALILGLGMSCVMVWADALFFPGIVIGIIGMGVTALAYPIYVHITKKERERVAPEILRLTEELMK